MKIGFLQMNSFLLEKEKNLDRALHFLEKIKADLIVLPELFNTGYNFKSRQEVESVAEPLNGKTISSLREIAVEKDLCIIAGFAEKAGHRFYNSAAVITPNYTGKYQKTHLFYNEKKFFSLGTTGFRVFRYKGVRIGVMICFDWRFPESARTLALKGADIIAHPANLVMTPCPDAMVTRSLENWVFTITADRIGKERGLEYIGKSQITEPNGNIIYRASSNKEELKIVEINPKKARNKRINPLNDLLKDRRPDFYK